MLMYVPVASLIALYTIKNKQVGTQSKSVILIMIAVVSIFKLIW